MLPATHRSKHETKTSTSHRWVFTCVPYSSQFRGRTTMFLTPKRIRGRCNTKPTDRLRSSNARLQPRTTTIRSPRLSRKFPSTSHGNVVELFGPRAFLVLRLEKSSPLCQSAAINPGAVCVHVSCSISFPHRTERSGYGDTARHFVLFEAGWVNFTR